jgi:prefoldin subunit 5
MPKFFKTDQETLDWAIPELIASLQDDLDQPGHGAQDAADLQAKIDDLKAIQGKSMVVPWGPEMFARGDEIHEAVIEHLSGDC